MVRNILIVVGVLLLVGAGFYGYTRFFVDTTEQLSVEELDDSFVGKAIIEELNRFKAINLNTELFADPAYQSLVDGTPEIAAEPVGRVDPFAPTGGGVQSQVILGGTSTSRGR